MKNKFVIIGAGSTHTPGILAVLAQRAEELKLGELCLHDIDVYIIWENLIVYIWKNIVHKLKQVGQPIYVKH